MPSGPPAPDSGEAPAGIPAGIHLPRHLELVGRHLDLTARRVVLLLLAAVLGLALAGVFGQRPVTARASGAAATLTVVAPERVRGGLLTMARFRIDAHQELRRAALVLDPGWAESLQINTIEPSPIGEASRDGKLVLELGHVPKGGRHVLYMQFQVNPTNVGHRSQDVRLEDEGRHIVTVRRSLTVFP